MSEGKCPPAWVCVLTAILSSVTQLVHFTPKNLSFLLCKMGLTIPVLPNLTVFPGLTQGPKKRMQENFINDQTAINITEAVRVIFPTDVSRRRLWLV